MIIMNINHAQLRKVLIAKDELDLKPTREELENFNRWRRWISIQRNRLSFKNRKNK
jgi:hypothetical protein